MASATGDIETSAALTIHVVGVHCANCESSIKRELGKISGVTEARANRRNGTAAVRYRGAIDLEEVRAAITRLGYRVASFEPERIATLRERGQQKLVQIGLAFAAVVVFVLLVQWLGLVPRGLTVSDNTGYGLAFLIGLVASVIRCMAVTGGLLLAVAARYAEVSSELPAWRRFQPHLAFNAGRLLPYPLLGGFGAPKNTPRCGCRSAQQGNQRGAQRPSAKGASR